MKSFLCTALAGVALALSLCVFCEEGYAQDGEDPFVQLYSDMTYRCIGPFRGGRSAAVTGVPGAPNTFYFGGTGGGVWKSENGGVSWENISDGFFGGSIGAVAVSQWDKNIIYAGGGEKTVRGNVSHGYGMWKSIDAGKTWNFVGLKDSRHIPRIRIHPRDPDMVYVAALGHLFGPNQERGVFRSDDGGDSWERVLFVDDKTGCVDLVMDPTNPRVLFAAMWQVKRTPYSLESGGPGSSLWKSTDGGSTWRDISRKNGLPDGTLGIIGVTVSPVNPERIWAIVEAKDGGVFRSEDGGETWRRINSDRNLRQRAWYYTRIYADTQDEDRVYVLNVQFWRSTDGGRTYESLGTPHGDHHDLWIAPEDPNRMIIGDDGGAQVTYDGGESWSSMMNQPTAQFYRVTTDTHFPYRIYGAQQDNSTVRIYHRTSGGAITEDDWESTAGGESGWLAIDPKDPEIVYGGSYGGYLQRLNHRTGESRNINAWPDNPMGHGAIDYKYRFQWNFPILFSRYDETMLYTAANVLFVSANEGQSWRIISPDLTRADSSKLGSSGGPITKDNTSVEYYATIFTVAESAHERGVIWTGSDDGLLHVTRDGGETWQNVTPPEKIMPEWIQINCIEPHPFEPGGVYVAATMYKSDDFAPYLYKTDDYGKSWRKIVNGIDAEHFTRAIRADRHRRGLLYAGTESGMYISFDDGERWLPFQLNLPVVPVTDLALKDKHLIVATQGRSFWVFDYTHLLHQLDPSLLEQRCHLFAPEPTYRLGGGYGGGGSRAGANPLSGVVLHYYLDGTQDSTSAALKIHDSSGAQIHCYLGRSEDRSGQLPMKRGVNVVNWNMRYPDAETFPGMILWSGNTRGPLAAPGDYSARLVVGDDSTAVPFTIVKDPRSESSDAELRAQFDFLIEVRDKLTETHRAIRLIRALRTQINAVGDRLQEGEGEKDIRSKSDALLERLSTIERALYQTKNQSRQDPLNYPIRLNNKLAALAGVVASGNYRPTDQAVAVKEELTEQIDVHLQQLYAILEKEVPELNELMHAHKVPLLYVERK